MTYAGKAAQRKKQGVAEVPDTGTVTTALNVPLISHQSLLHSLERDKKLLPTVQSPPLGSACLQSNHPFGALNHTLTIEKVQCSCSIVVGVGWGCYVSRSAQYACKHKYTV